jgi:hypothetical protein
MKGALYLRVVTKLIEGLGHIMYFLTNNQNYYCNNIVFVIEIFIR